MEHPVILNMNKKILLAASLSFLLFSCGSEPKYNNPQPIIKKDTITEPLIKANKQIGEKEKHDIENFVKRKGWPMKETGTGLQYSIYKPGTGEAVQSGDLVMVDFEITLLNGTLCYTSEETGSEEFVVDHDHVESGLHEALKYLRVGDQAKIIIPSHLAFGLAGDMDKIPPLSPIVYDLTVLDKKTKPKK
jgi:FKBP-type peptidyl-prolyl cis-trans isomerase FkpA